MHRSLIAILAQDTDAHAIAVRDRLGDAARIIDITQFPDHVRISLGERLDDIVIDGEQLRPAAVYLRDFGVSALLAEELGGEHWRRAIAAQRERSDFVQSIVQRWDQLGIAIYNPPSSLARITKPYQLALLAAAGLPVPQTRWTNDPDEVRRFAATRRIVYKPVAGGALARELAPADLERLDRLSAAPVCFQELLPGHDVRAYVVDGEVVSAARIETDAVDYRGRETAVHVLAVDAELRELCVRATAALGLRFAGIDLKADANGRLVLLELNSSPMFLGLDARIGSDILGALCAALRRHEG